MSFAQFPGNFSPVFSKAEMLLKLAQESTTHIQYKNSIEHFSFISKGTGQLATLSETVCGLGTLAYQLAEQKRIHFLCQFQQMSSAI